MRDRILLRQLQALPLVSKITMTEQRIIEWYEHYDGKVCVCFSGGKDSTVLAHIVHGIYPDVPLVFSNTGLEYPEIQAFARKMGAEFIYPKMKFSEVVSTYGYPIISKEVAECIWYARKMRDFKETERRRSDLNGTRSHTRTECRREMLTGEFGDPDYKSQTGERTIKRMELLGEYAGSYKETYEAAQNGTAAKTDSMFNKVKWRALCDETAFLIGDKCCQVMKKAPLKAYQRKEKRKPIIGTMAEESRTRAQSWIKNGCNAFDRSDAKSQPMSLWTVQNVLEYIRKNNIEIASVYGEIVATDGNGFVYDPMPGVECKLHCTGCQRTGCIFCGFGAHFDKESRFVRLSKTHPKQYEYCMQGGQWVDNPSYDPTAPKMDGDWTNWNPKKIWVPSKKGLGMKKVFDDCNQIYGKDFIRYE